MTFPPVGEVDAVMLDVELAGKARSLPLDGRGGRAVDLDWEELVERLLAERAPWSHHGAAPDLPLLARTRIPFSWVSGDAPWDIPLARRYRQPLGIGAGSARRTAAAGHQGPG